MRKLLSYSASAVYEHSRDRFYASLFVPEPAREALLIVCALDVELAHIRRAVTEELLGHMRHAWWQESLEAICNGGPPREHPVFQAIAPLITNGNIPKDKLMALVESYRSAFPNMPDNSSALDVLSLSLLENMCLDAILAWQKARQVIDTHRAHFGTKKNSWLLLKLLWIGAAR